MLDRVAGSIGATEPWNASAIVAPGRAEAEGVEEAGGGGLVGAGGEDATAAVHDDVISTDTHKIAARRTGTIVRPVITRIEEGAGPLAGPFDARSRTSRQTS